MRLLVIVLRSPFDTHSGNGLILRNHLRHLHERHEIDLVIGSESPGGVHPELSRWCQRVVTVAAPTRLARYFSQLKGLLARRPIRVSGYANPALERVVAGLVRERQYDAALVQLCEAAQFRPREASLPCVLDFEDPPSIKIVRTLPWSRGLVRLVALLDARLMRRYEASLAQAFDRLVFVSARDAVAFGTLHDCPEKVRQVHHAVEALSQPVGLAGRPKQAMIVTGNMAHPPNVAAVHFLCRAVFPLVRRELPEAELWLVGANPTPAVAAWANVPGITVTGAVPDVQSYLSRARVALCGVPVVLGTQTKVLEALAAGTPVVTTSAGNHGIDAADAHHLYLADTPAEFARRAISLLRGEAWAAMADAGWRLVQERYSPAGAAAALERAIVEAVESRRTVSSPV